MYPTNLVTKDKGNIRLKKINNYLNGVDENNIVVLRPL